ncbi:MAG: hypothetical protein ACE5IW_09930 [bacterium]
MANIPVNIKSGEPNCRVVPGSFRAKKPRQGTAGDSVTFNAKQIKEEVAISFPHGIFDVDRVILNSSNGFKETLDVQSDAPEGRHNYTVKHKNDSCVGASPPQIIID